jgi:hypothetical protein
MFKHISPRTLFILKCTIKLKFVAKSLNVGGKINFNVTARELILHE